MTFTALLLIAIGLSMDAFGASVSRGAAAHAAGRAPHFLGPSLVFGVFAALAPVLGWALGKALYDVIQAYDHWIAFALLLFVGAKMIRDGFGEPEPKTLAQGYRLLVLVMAAVATSIDAAAVGITLPMLRVDISLAAGVIGLVTFVAALVGATVGRRAGALAGRRAEVVGGILLIAIGVRIVVEHTLFGPGAA